MDTTTATTTTTTLTMPEHTTRRRRRMSTTAVSPTRDRNREQPLRPRLSACHSLPHQLDALDLPTPSIRALLFTKLDAVSDPSQRLEALLRAYLPDIHLPDLSDLKDVLPDLSDSTLAAQVRALRAHLPSPTMSTSALPAVLDELVAELRDDAEEGEELLLDTLTNMRGRASQMRLRAEAAAGDMRHRAELAGEDFKKAIASGEELLTDWGHAVQRSMHGAKLILYQDLPHQWRNNPFVEAGYRFIPIEKWPLIIASMFAWHNETLNIHTHLIPLLHWARVFLPRASSVSLPTSYHPFLDSLLNLPYAQAPRVSDAAEAAYVGFSLLCLALSCVWHTMAGCAHEGGMELCARVDYCGIGWLIAASVGTVVHYGFACYPALGQGFLCLCLASAISANIVPFMAWFNQVEYRTHRLCFFLLLLFCILVGPIGTLSYLHSPSAVAHFVTPVMRSLAVYTAGFVVYATHAPERFLRGKVGRAMDRVGAGSHAIWHLCIVVAIGLHWQGMREMRDGIRPCPAAY